jgi:hypothetical protein
VHGLARPGGVLAPADLQSALDRALAAACLAVQADEIRIGPFTGVIDAWLRADITLRAWRRAPR